MYLKNQYIVVLLHFYRKILIYSHFDIIFKRIYPDLVFITGKNWKRKDFSWHPWCMRVVSCPRRKCGFLPYGVCLSGLLHFFFYIYDVVQIHLSIAAFRSTIQVSRVQKTTIHNNCKPDGCFPDIIKIIPKIYYCEN